MSKYLPAMLVFIFLLAPALPASAQEGMPTMGAGDIDMDQTAGYMGGMARSIDMMTWPRMGKSCRTPDFYLARRGALDLSGMQIEALKKMRSALAKTLIIKGAAVKVLELELSEIVERPDFKLADAQAKLKEVETARLDLRSEMLKASAEARDALGPEQLEKLKEMDLELPGAEQGMSPEGMKQKMMMEKMKEKMMK